jgi:hypothetical protein
MLLESAECQILHSGNISCMMNAHRGVKVSNREFNMLSYVREFYTALSLHPHRLESERPRSCH